MKYDSGAGIYSFSLPKKIKGQFFEDLQMLTQLLSPPANDSRGKVSGDNKCLIQELHDPSLEELTENSEGETQFEWFIPQNIWTEEDEKKCLMGEKYGFANTKTGILSRFKDEGILDDILDVEDPEHKTPTERRKERIQKEQNDFDDEFYLDCLYENQEEIQELLTDTTFWYMKSDDLTPEEKVQMKELLKKSYLLEADEKKQLFLGLVDILYAYSYDMRVNEGEESSESYWNICKISSTLSWLETFDSLQDVIISCFRRSLCYPLYRHWELSSKVLCDVISIFEKGKITILKCMLHVHRILNHTLESRYILNDLYLTDYCVWLQGVSESTFQSLTDALKKIDVSKGDVDLDIPLLERAAQLTIQEASGADNSNDYLSALTNTLSLNDKRVSDEDKKCNK